MSQPRPTTERELVRLRARVAELEQHLEAHDRTVRQHIARQEEQARILRSMVDSMADGLAVADENGHFLLFNPAAERILGIGPVQAGPEEWTRFYGLFLPDTVTPYPTEELPLARAMRGEAVDGAEVFVRNARLPDGVWLSVNARPLRDEAGVLRGGMAVFRDITAAKRAEEALEKERTLLRTIIDNLPDYIYVKDLHSRFLAVNRALATGVGASSPDDVLGKTDFDFFPPELAAQYRADEEQVLATGQPLVNRQERVLDRHGALRWFLTTKVPLRNPAGAVVGLVGISRDVTDRVEAEQELVRAREVAEAANRAKSLFLANMSHEIRTPMNGIFPMTELLLDTPLTPEQRDYVETVKRSADHLLTVINDILDFSKIEAGRLDLDLAPFGLRETVGDALAALAVRAHQKGLELACRVPPGVPDLLIGDRVRLRQVLVNLVGNAIKFTEQGEVVVHVATERQTEEEAVLHFHVVDTGVGIPADKLPLIFAPFTQVDDSLTRRHGGTGLGLAITQRLVELMGGRVEVESEPGKGSRFTFTARFGVMRGGGVSGGWRPDLSAPHPASLAPHHMKGLPVLVVDDNATNRFILEETLTGWQMRPTAVASGEAALEALRVAAEDGEPFPLVLLDANMPGMDGLEVAEEIRKRPAWAGAVVLMLSSGGPADAGRRRALGISCLTKPVRQAELWKAIVSAIGHRPSADSRQPIADSRQPTECLPPTLARPLRILLAEDNPVNQQVAVRLLQKQGHQVEVVENGRQAVETAGRGGFDLVLMDVQMPEMNGLEAAAAIRREEAETGRRVPILAMTAYAMKGDREKCLEAGMDGYIPKPVRPQELFAAIAGQCHSEADSGTTGTDQPAGMVLDWSAALEFVGGDRELLQEVIEAFLAECPRWRNGLRRALEEGSLAEVKRFAHNVKSAAAHLGARRASRAAFVLEEMGRTGNLSGAGEAYLTLENELDLLMPALANVPG